MVGKREDRNVLEKINILSLLILKCNLKSFTKKAMLNGMNEDMAMRPLKTDLSVLQHSISFIPPKDPTA